MTQENHSSKREDKNKTEELEKKDKELKNLKKILELQQKTIDHNRRFGHYEMM